MSKEDDSNKSIKVKIGKSHTVRGSINVAKCITDSFNVLTPENVTMLVAMLGSAVGITTTVIKGIQLWVDEKKARKIKIRYKDTELEISGSIGEMELQEKIETFCKLHEKFTKEEVEINIIDDK